MRERERDFRQDARDAREACSRTAHAARASMETLLSETYVCAALSHLAPVLTSLTAADAACDVNNLQAT